MATYNLDNFVAEPTNTDRTMRIYDKNNILVYSFVPDMAYFFYKNNYVIIKVEDQDNIVLDFDSTDIAVEALKKLNRIKSDINDNCADTCNTNCNPGGGVTTLFELTDTLITTSALTEDSFLKWDTTINKWVNFDLSVISGSTFTNPNPTPISVGGIGVGSSFDHKNMTEMWNQLLYPVIDPTKINKTASIGGVDTSNVEVGTAISLNLTHTFNPGSIDSKDSHPTIPLVGSETNIIYGGPGVSGNIVNMNATFGTMTWNANISHSVGIGEYYDSYGNISNIFDSDRVASFISVNASKHGYYRYWYTTSETPLSLISTEIRNIISQPGRPNDTENYFSSNNPLQLQISGELIFYYDIPANKKWSGFYFQGNVKTVTVININTFSTIDLTSTNNVIIKDAGGNDINYTLYNFDLGGSNGLTEWQTFRVNINL